jgi:hypothetical protein
VFKIDEVLINHHNVLQCHHNIISMTTSMLYQHFIFNTLLKCCKSTITWRGQICDDINIQQNGFWRLKFMVYQNGKINKKKPIFNSHQKGNLVILETLFCTCPTWPRCFFLPLLRWRFWLVILTRDYLTSSQIEQFH